MSKKYKILHLEDVASDAELVARELKVHHIPCEIRVVATEEAYKEALAAFSPDVILCDHILPAFNSFEAFQILKAQNLHIPFIIITATLTEEVAMTMVREGAEDYILKDRLKRLPHAVINAVEKFRYEKARKQLLDDFYTTEANSKELLQQLSSKILLATKVAGIGIWEYVFEENKFIADDVLLSQYGITSADFIGTYDSWMKYIHPDDKKRIDEEFKNALTRYSDFDAEFKVVWPDGSIHHINGVAVLQRDQAGKPSGFIGTNQDITERKNAESQKEFEKTNTEALINCTEDAIWSVGKDFKLIAANGTFIKNIELAAGITLRPGDDLLSPGIFPADFLTLWKGFYETALEGKSIKEELHIPPLNNGVEIWLEVCFNPIYINNTVAGIACYSRNITAERSAAAKIKQSEARLAASQSVAKVGSWETDLSSLDVILSDEACRIFGLETCDPHTSHENFLKLVHPGDKEKVDGAFSASFASNSLNSIEHRIITSDGIIKDVEERWHIIKDETGKPKQAVGTVQDITERKLTEKLIKESEAKYRAFFENSLDGILLTITDGAILSANPAACAMFGMTEEEICAAGRLGIIDLKDARAEELIKQRQLTGKASGELTYLRKNGTTFQGEISSVLFIDSYGQERTSMIIRDISKRKEVEEKLVNTSRELQLALNDLNNIMSSCLDIICTINRQGEFVTASAASKTIFGYTPQEMKGLKFMDLIHPDDVQRSNDAAAQIVQGASVSMFENRYIRKDGSIVPMLWSARWDETDELMYCIAKDATEKKRLEKAFEYEKQRFTDMFATAPASLGILKGPDHIFEMANPNYLKLIGRKNIIGKNVREIFPELLNEGFFGMLDSVYKTGKPVILKEAFVSLKKEGIDTPKYLDFMYQAYKDFEGKTEGIFFFAIDVTEQVLSRAKIEESEIRLKEAQAISNIGNWEIDLLTNQHYWSDEVYRLFGINRGDVTPSEEVFMSFCHPDDLEKTYELIREGFEKLEDISLQFRYVRKDGEVRYSHNQWKYKFNDKGEAVVLSGIIQDITERKKAVDKIKQNELRYRSLIEQATDAICIADETLKFIDINPYGCEIFGYTVEEALQLSLPDILFGEDLAANPLKPSAVKFGTTVRSERRLKRKDGTAVNMDVSTRLMEDGRFIMFGHDITERKNAEKLLEAAYDEKNTILESISDAFFSVDKNWVVTFWNKEAEKVLMKPRNEIMGHQLWRVFSDSIDSASYKNYHLSVEKNEAVRFEDHYPALNKWYEISAFPSELGLSVYFKDISERKISEIRLNELNKSLQKQSFELSVSNEELERFAYVTSHDLQEPLRMVTSFLQLLQKKYDAQLDDTAQKYIHFAVDGAGRMKALIQDLLEFSRISSVKVEHHFIDLNAVLNKTKDSLKALIDETGAVINISFLPRVCGNEFQLVQLFQNLIGNAIKYRYHHAPAIEIGYTENKIQWQFYVKDNGIGIDEKYFDKIFIIFQRLHNKKEYKGTGIGLAICKKIAELHGGKIWLTSSAGQGTTFYFTIDKKQSSDEAETICQDEIDNPKESK